MIGTLSPVAVKTGEPAVAELTVKVATPFASDVLPVAGKIVSGGVPRPDTKETPLPATRFELASIKVTVIVEVAIPSAVAVAGRLSPSRCRQPPAPA